LAEEQREAPRNLVLSVEKSRPASTVASATSALVVESPPTSGASVKRVPNGIMYIAATNV